MLTLIFIVILVLYTEVSKGDRALARNIDTKLLEAFKKIPDRKKRQALEAIKCPESHKETLKRPPSPSRGCS